MLFYLNLQITFYLIYGVKSSDCNGDKSPTHSPTVIYRLMIIVKILKNVKKLI